RLRQGRPAVTVKLAQTADGFAARRLGPRLMITGEATQARVHLLRAHCDALLVGVGTVLADDPMLTVRLPGLEGRSPVRIVFDTGLRTPARSRIAASARDHPTWIVTTPAASPAAERALTAAGVEVMRVETAAPGRVDLRAALGLIATRGITRILCEGGPTLADALAAADLIDEVVLATAPQRLGEAGLPAIGRLAPLLRTRFAPLPRETLGADLIETFERMEKPCSPGL
ncbi:MAG: Diaminohydroxyphosphoribosylaminopyrimidine deaminase / 5-amino-6-(5-phosphoribosylamino)uracil reductase, partial [uncultured Microvirga sp.]